MGQFTVAVIVSVIEVTVPAIIEVKVIAMVEPGRTPCCSGSGASRSPSRRVQLAGALHARAGQGGASKSDQKLPGPATTMSFAPAETCQLSPEDAVENTSKVSSEPRRTRRSCKSPLISMEATRCPTTASPSRGMEPSPSLLPTRIAVSVTSRQGDQSPRPVRPKRSIGRPASSLTSTQLAAFSRRRTCSIASGVTRAPMGNE